MTHSTDATEPTSPQTRSPLGVPWPLLATGMAAALLMIAGLWWYVDSTGSPISWHADRDAAFFTLILAICGTVGMGLSAYGVWLLRQTLIATRHTLTAAQDTVELTRQFNERQTIIGLAQNRPYMSIHSVEIAPPPQDCSVGEEEVVTLKILISNKGKMPAVNVSIAVLAIDTPYFRTSDTRREAEPDWENCGNLGDDTMENLRLYGDVIVTRQIPGGSLYGTFSLKIKVRYTDPFGGVLARTFDINSLLETGRGVPFDGYFELGAPTAGTVQEVSPPELP